MSRQRATALACSLLALFALVAVAPRARALDAAAKATRAQAPVDRQAELVAPAVDPLQAGSVAPARDAAPGEATAPKAAPAQLVPPDEEAWGDEWFDDQGAEAARAIEQEMLEAAGDAGPAQEPSSDPAPDLAPAPPPGELLIPPTHGPADLVAAWRDRREAYLRQDEAAAAAAERRLGSMLRALDVREVHAFAGAAIQESRRLEDARPEEALRRAELAVRLAPSLPGAHLQLLRARFAADPANVAALAEAAWSGLQAGLEDPRALRLLALDLAAAGGGALLWAGAVILALLAIVHLRAALHDLHHRFPAGVSPVQTSVFAALVVATPWVLGLGPAIPAALVLAGIWRQLLVGERVALSIWLVLICLLPAGAAQLAREAAWESTPAAAVWAVERQGDFTQLGEVRRLAEQEEAPPEVLFAAARARKRLGELDGARALYERALQDRPRWAQARNNLGNVLFLQGDLDGAAALYGQAIDLEPGLAIAHYNLSRVHYDRLDLGAGQRSRARATALDPALAARYQLDGEHRRANRWVIDATLEGSDLRALAARAAAADADALAASLSTRLVAPLAPAAAGATGAGLVGLLALAPAVVGRRRRATSSCRRCGRPTCASCDAEVEDGGDCGQCRNVFEGRVRVDEDARERKERQVRTHESRRTLYRWAAGVLFAAPFLEGRLVVGPVVALVGWFAVLLAVVPQGVVAPPWQAIPAPWKWALLALPIAATAFVSIRSARRQGWP